MSEEKKLFYTRRGVNRYKKSDGTISEYQYHALVERKRKIELDEDDFKAFMLEYGKVGDSKQAAKNTKVAHSVAMKIALTRYLDKYMAELALEEEHHAAALSDEQSAEASVPSPPPDNYFAAIARAPVL